MRYNLIVVVLTLNKILSRGDEEFSEMMLCKNYLEINIVSLK